MNAAAAIVWRQSPLPPGVTPEDILEALRKRLAGRVERAYLFGSFATMDFHAASDIDIILIKQTTMPFWERAREFDDLYDIYPRIDLLVYRDDEFQHLIQQPSGYWRSVKTSMRPLLP